MIDGQPVRSQSVSHLDAGGKPSITPKMQLSEKAGIDIEKLSLGFGVTECALEAASFSGKVIFFETGDPLFQCDRAEDQNLDLLYQSHTQPCSHTNSVYAFV